MKGKIKMIDRWSLFGVAIAVVVGLLCGYAANGAMTMEMEKRPIKTTTTETL